MIVSDPPRTPPRLPSLPAVRQAGVGQGLNAHDAGQMHPSLQYSITPTRPPRLSESDGGQVIQLEQSP